MTRHQTIVLLSVSCGIFFEALDIAIVNLAIPLIREDFQLPADTIQWMQTIYVLFYGGFLILGGKLSDTIGRKKLFLLGSGIFLCTSLAAALANSFLILCIARGLQGLGAAFLMPAAFSIVTNTFQTPMERNKALGIFGSFAAIGSGSGLSIGGLIATYLGWQWIFLINVPVITISMIIAFYAIDSDRLQGKRSKIDILSAVSLTIGLVVLSFVIHDMKAVGDNLKTILILIAITGICATIFIKRSKSEDPLIPFQIFNHRLTLLGNGIMVLMGAFFTGFLFMISLVMQSYMDFSAAKSGLLLVPFSFLSAIVSKTILPSVLKRITPIDGALLGMGLMTMGGVSMLVAMWFGLPLVIVLLSVAFVTGTGIAVCFITLNVIVLKEIPERDHGLGSSFTNTCFFLGGGIGLSIIGVFLPKDNDVLPWASVCALTSYAAVGLIWLIVATKQYRKKELLS